MGCNSHFRPIPPARGELMREHQFCAVLGLDRVCCIDAKGEAHAGAMKLMGQLTNMMMLKDQAIRTDDSANVRVTRPAGDDNHCPKRRQRSIW
jgi:hypothetical protein